MLTAGHLLLLVGLSAQGEPPAAEAPSRDGDLAKVHAAEVLELAQAEAAKYEFRLETDPNTKLTLQPHSILRWSNPVSGPVYGEVFVWTAAGRPEVVAAIYRFYSQRHRHASAEFHSLSPGKLQATRDGRRVWFPSGGGVELSLIPDAPPPADSPTRRLRQMKALAREFSAEAIYPSPDDPPWQLRLMIQPVYRYRSTGADLLDGAMFAFAQGTNPDVWLLIEARKTPHGARWQYGLARMHLVALRVFHKGRRVWSVDRLPTSRRDPLKPYVVFGVPTAAN